MPLLKVNIRKEQQERIEKEYFEKIAKKKPDQLSLYKKCYYEEKLSSFTKEEKHNALFDAKIIKMCYDRLISN